MMMRILEVLMSREYFAKSKIQPGVYRFLLLLFLSFSFLWYFFPGIQAYAGQASLSWEAPSTNEDGTSLTDLNGYKIYYGTAPGNYTQNVDVGNVTTYTFTNLTDGQTYYFVATAYNSAGVESSYSNEVTKIIPASIQAYTLSVNKAGSGVITSSPAGISCGADCSEAYTAGTVVTLTATPDGSSSFAGWSGACTGSGTCTVTMADAGNVAATFNLKSYEITATAGSGGSISPTGTTFVKHGSNQSFTITANAGYSIADVLVDGASVGAVASYTFPNLTAAHTISAGFSVLSYALTVSNAGTGTGTVTSSPKGISCGGDCTEGYTAGTVVTLTAAPDRNSSFAGWSGACTGSGTCTVTIDAARNVAATFNDAKAPDLTISTLSDGSWTNNETLNISGTVNDNIGLPQLTMNGTAVMVNPDGTFSMALNLMVGPNTINTIASDLAGLQATDTRTINFDPTAPNISITTPADNGGTRNSTIEISGTVNESSMVFVKVNDYNPLPAQMDGNNFAMTVPLTYGINTIEILATDLAGNNSSLKRTVTYDDRSPALSITAPGQDIKTNQSSMIIRGTVSDMTAATVTVEQDQETFTPAVTRGSFEQPIVFTVEKTYQIYVTAADELGNETTVQRNIIYDATPPSFTLDMVASPTNLNSQILAGTVEATASVSVVCPTASVGQVNYPTQTTWTASLTDMAEGNNLITITASDEAGNVSGQIGETIVVDTVTPDTTITRAPDNPSTSTSASFSFTSTDVSSAYQCRLDYGGYQPCTSPKSYTNLSVGIHTFSVVATDAAGNMDLVPASYTWSITQAQLPDLSGQWLLFNSRSAGRKISGLFKILNSGNRNAGSFVVTYYLSPDGTTLSGVLKRYTLRSLRAGRSTSMSFSYNSATSLSNKYIVAVIDSGNAIDETNENNNTAVTRIP